MRKAWKDRDLNRRRLGKEGIDTRVEMGTQNLHEDPCRETVRWGWKGRAGSSCLDVSFSAQLRDMARRYLRRLLAAVRKRPAQD